MAEYRTVRMAFWHDPYIEGLDAKAKLLYLYLFTCPYANNLGVVEATRRKMAYETALPVAEVDKFLEAFQEAGKVVCDPEHNLVFLTNFIRHQSSTSPKIIDGLRKLAPSIRSPIIAKALCIRYPDVYGVTKDASDTVSIPYANGIHTLCIPSGEFGSWNLEVGKGKLEEGRKIAPNPDGFRAESGTLVCGKALAKERAEKGDPPPRDDLTACCLPVKSPDMSEVAYLKAENWKTWVDTYGEAFCTACLKGAYAWALSNPAKAKTVAGLHKFFNNWLKNEQNKPGGGARASPPCRQPVKTFQQQAEESVWAGFDRLLEQERKNGEQHGV